MIRKASGVQASLGGFRLPCMPGITESLPFQTAMYTERSYSMSTFCVGQNKKKPIYGPMYRKKVRDVFQKNIF